MIKNRVLELKDYFYGENNKLPSDKSEKLLFQFLNKFDSIRKPSITISDNGFFSIRYIVNEMKVILSFKDDNFIEFVIKNISDNNPEVIEGYTKIENCVKIIQTYVK